MDNEKISVIVPVYRVEEYLPRCLESIINQTYKDIEIILVDDGSPDNSGKICDEYAEIDSRIRVIHKKNGGASSARNVGLNTATGKYIGFVDGDDAIESDMYEFLMGNMKRFNADIARCGAVREGENKKEEWGDNDAVPLTRNNIESICDVGEANGFLPVCVWNKLYKYDIIKDIRFDERFVYAEDVLFSYYAACKAEKTVICDKIKYHYTANSESTSHKIFDKERFDEHKVCDIIMNEQKDNKITYPYCVKGDVLKSFRTIKEMVISQNEMEYFKEIRKRILTHKKEIFVGKIYSKITKMKTLLLWLFPRVYKKYIKISRG